MANHKIKSSHWIVDDQDRIIMGEGRMAILDCIQETGSINQAAKSLHMSYKTAWTKIRTTEAHFKAKIVHTDKARGTRLTKEGKALLEQYRQLKSQCLAADDRLFRQIFKSSK